MLRTLAAFAVALSLVLPAAAEDAKPAPKAQPGTGVEMPFLIAPLSKDGNLIGYAYISSKLVATSVSAAIAIREKLAFIQDANVRDVNAVPISKNGDPATVDSAALAQRLAANARRIVGDSKILRMDITALQFAPLHPDGTTLGTMNTSPEDAARLTGANQSAATPSTTAPPAAPAAATSEPAKPQAH